MDKQKIADFFDKCAPWWDDDMIRNEDLITLILDNCEIGPDKDVLDVACGTGVLFPDYLSRNVTSVTGIDISPEMAKIAASKFPEVEVICGDVEETEFAKQYDCIMVYNAFPHFPDPKKLIARLSQLVKPGGRLSIAHGMSRAALTSHHSGRASDVSIDLLHEEELAAILAPWFDVDVVISNDRMYQVCGVRRAEMAPETAELKALLKYMVSHNDAHAMELAELAQQMRQIGKEDIYAAIMDAVADFDVGNARLSSVLEDLT